jgi:hypothetical protein
MVTTEYFERNHYHQVWWIITSYTDDTDESPHTYSPVPLGFRFNRDDADAANCEGRAGNPVDCALKDFNERYAQLSSSLSSLPEDIGFGAEIPDSELAQLWIERNDAPNYVIVSDPAARLRVDAMH